MRNRFILPHTASSTPPSHPGRWTQLRLILHQRRFPPPLATPRVTQIRARPRPLTPRRLLPVSAQEGGYLNHKRHPRITKELRFTENGVRGSILAQCFQRPQKRTRRPLPSEPHTAHRPFSHGHCSSAPLQKKKKSGSIESMHTGQIQESGMTGPPGAPRQRARPQRADAQRHAPLRTQNGRGG